LVRVYWWPESPLSTIPLLTSPCCGILRLVSTWQPAQLDHLQPCCQAGPIIQLHGSCCCIMLGYCQSLPNCMKQSCSQAKLTVHNQQQRAAVLCKRVSNCVTGCVCNSVLHIIRSNN
jgi:hypothetical protein